MCDKNVGLGNGPLRAVIQASDGRVIAHLEAESGIEKVFLSSHI